MKRITEVEILRYQNNEVKEMMDEIIVEYSLTVVVNGIELITLLCSPHALKDLAVGYLVTEGIIDKKEDIVSLVEDYDNNRISIEITNQEIVPDRMKQKPTKASGGAKGTVSYSDPDNLGDYVVESDMRVKADMALEFADILSHSSELFQKTGGVHSTFLCDADNVLLFMDDVGRHNAVDKIIGHAFLNDIPLDDKILVCSGRISSEMLYKALKNKIPFIISRSAPMNLAVQNARKRNATLVCFARGKRMNIYSGVERIIFE